MKPTADIAQGFYSDISGEAYHQGPGVSSSQIKTLVQGVPLDYWGEYVVPDPKGEKSTEAKDFGSAYHKAVLEPDEFFTEFVVPPKKWNLKRTSDRAERDAYLAQHPDRVFVTLEQLDQVKRMRDALLANPEIERLLSGALCEQSGYWHDPDTGLLLKYRPDAWKPLFIADIKTCVDCSPRGFQRTLDKFGYDNSAAHYLDGDRIVNGTEHETFVLIAQEKHYPFKANYYPVEQYSLDAAREENHRAIDKLAECLKTDKWPGYSPQELGRSRYRLRQQSEFED